MEAMQEPEQDLTNKYYISHFTDFLPHYISHGRPAPETLRKYTSEIRHYIAWCRSRRRSPLRTSAYQIQQFHAQLVSRQYSSASVAHMLVAVRTFFSIAQQLGLVRHNPCLELDISAPELPAVSVQPHLALEQLDRLISADSAGETNFAALRRRLLLYLLAIEGLRITELHQLNREDLDLELGSITIRSRKSSALDAAIYPCAATLQLLAAYLQAGPEEAQIKRTSLFTPLILAESHRNKWGRLSLDAIRQQINHALTQAGLKVKGLSCHQLRHSCGSNLYQLTKDLQLVRDTLRQTDMRRIAGSMPDRRPPAVRASELLVKGMNQARQPSKEEK